MLCCCSSLAAAGCLTSVRCALGLMLHNLSMSVQRLRLCLPPLCSEGSPCKRHGARCLCGAHLPLPITV